MKLSKVGNCEARRMFNSVFLVRASQNGSQQGAADSVSGTVLCLGKNSISNSFISIPLSHAELGDVNTM